MRVSTHGAVRTALTGIFVTGVFGLAGAGCAGYSESVRGMHEAIAVGDTELALTNANAALGVDNENQEPGSLEGDAPLLLLERALLLQAMGEHEAAIRDFAEADGVLEVLDLSGDTMGDVGQYLFSDDSTLYRVPPHEKLLINTLAMVSYLSLGDIDGAQVEARRLAVLQKFFQDAAPEERALFGLGSYLAGYAFEKGGDPSEALLYYIEAYETHGYALARGPIVYLGDALGSSQDVYLTLKEEMGEVPRPAEDQGEVLVVIENGRAPYKVPERFPVGAFVVAPVDDSHWQMSADERRQADEMAISGLFKWINFPVLVEVGPRYLDVDLKVDGRSEGPPPLVMDIEQSAVAAWREDEPKLRLAAFTRMLTRAIAAEATDAVASSATGQDGIGFLIGRLLEAGLTAADTPDTRSWTMLPASVDVYRVRVAPGQHVLGAIGRDPGSTMQRAEVNVPARGQRTAVFRFLN